MTAHTKGFIENNIGSIEAEDYYLLFDIWGRNYCYDDANDYSNLLDLFKTFEEAGIDLEGKSEAAREQLIKDQFEKYLKDAIDLTYVKSVGLAAAIKRLRSNLNIRLPRRRDLFQEVVENLGLEYSGLTAHIKRDDTSYNRIYKKLY